MKSKNGIATLFTGYNYGSALQAFALKKVCNDLGYDSEIIKLRGFSKGRDIRLNKLLVVLFRMLFHPSKYKAIKAYEKKNIPEYTKELFTEFYQEKINPNVLSYKQLKKYCRSGYYDFFICGSDQIWNSSTFYVDPFYYLRFIKKEKRIAYAPSFGRSFIANYNLRKIKRNVNEIQYLSIREKSGQALIKKYLHRDAEVLIDPSLLLSSNEWKNEFSLKKNNKAYVLLYFLDEPTEKTKKMIAEYCGKNALTATLILNQYQNEGWYDEYINAGPKEFLELIMNANHIFTDSFHGAVFSTIFHKTFNVFRRQYKGAEDQSTRVLNFLELAGLKDRFEPKTICNINEMICFDEIDKRIEREKNKSLSFLANAIKGAKNDK